MYEALVGSNAQWLRAAMAAAIAIAVAYVNVPGASRP